MVSIEEKYAAIVGFIEAFPDLKITMRDIAKEDRGTVFYWNLKGTNTGPGGTGNLVNIDGCEVWELNEENKIEELRGYLDADEYERQLQATLST
jgi:hypothetical protein